jgi:hypothetical protein
MKAEKVYETSEMPDHPPTTKKIWLGMLSGLLTYVIVFGICFLVYYANKIDDAFKTLALFLFRHQAVSFALLVGVSACLMVMIVRNAKKFY